jgi:hypothetical protein
MVAGTARSMGITVSGDLLLIKKKDMAKLTKAKKRLPKIERTNCIL